MTAQEHLTRYLETTHVLEMNGVRLEMESQLRQRLEQELEDLHTLLKHRLASTASGETETAPPMTDRKR